MEMTDLEVADNKLNTTLYFIKYVIPYKMYSKIFIAGYS